VIFMGFNSLLAKNFLLSTKIRVMDADIHSPPFYSPFLNELEGGNNSKKIYSHHPSLFQKRGDGGELREGCGGRR